MTSVINFPFDGRDIIFEDFSTLNPSSAISDGNQVAPTSTLTGEGFSFKFNPTTTTIRGLDAQGRFVFEGITRTVDDYAGARLGQKDTEDILPKRRVTRGDVVFTLEIDINQFSLGTKYSLGIKLQAEVAPGEPTHFIPPTTPFGDIDPSTADLTLSSAFISGEDSKVTNAFGGHLTKTLVGVGGPVTTRNDTTLLLDASIEVSSDFIDIRENFTNKNLIASVILEGYLMTFKRIILTKRESTS
jgi:hypothetical protein